MKTESGACEAPCKCPPVSNGIDLIVITGGPGAGKTAVLEFARKIFCEHVVVFPEAASILFHGGFWRLESVSAKKAAQRAIYHVQDEMEKMVREEKRWRLGLCDRGVLDGLAYWPGTEDEYFEELKTSMQAEFTRYKAVIQLHTPSLYMGYNYQNPVRTETPEQALRIDHKIHEIWKQHPNYFEVNSEIVFGDKLNQVLSLLTRFYPSCCKTNMCI